MTLATMHPEDIKAALRKRARSIAAFERDHGLPKKSVSDVLRGRKSARVINAIEKAISGAPLSETSDSSGGKKNHRLNGGAQ